MASSDSFSFPAFNFIKIETLAEIFFQIIFAKFLKTLFLRTSSDRWLLLAFTSEFWEILQNTFFIEHLQETAYIMYKLQEFNQHIQ